MISPPPIPEATKRKKRKLSGKNTSSQQEKKVPVKKKRSLQPVSVSTSPYASRSPSPTQSTCDSISSSQGISANATKRSIRAASAAINKREQDKESSGESSLSSQQTSEPTSPTKRSIRAASDAISKRELEKKLSVNTSPPDAPDSEVVEQKKSVVKRRRKLNTQKAVVLPNAESPSDEIDLEGAALNSYSKYLNPNKTTSNVAPITLGVSKKRKMIPKKSKSTSQHGNDEPAYTTDTTTTTTINDNNTSHIEEEPLDLSQHVILPNSSYIAHLRQPTRRSSMDGGNYYSDHSSNTSNKSSPTSEFFDAASDFDGQQDVFMSSLEENDSTVEYMDFEYKTTTQEIVVDSLPAQQVEAQPKVGFWQSVMTFARFSS